ncbi:MAG: hypothetical protein Q8R78_07680, partial [Candidatus Omnitrophota bacterium]|nr:hypothetical protein [Candidatus Omnitrophota bacterium]
PEVQRELFNWDRRMTPARRKFYDLVGLLARGDPEFTTMLGRVEQRERAHQPAERRISDEELDVITRTREAIRAHPLIAALIAAGLVGMVWQLVTGHVDAASLSLPLLGFGMVSGGRSRDEAQRAAEDLWLTRFLASLSDGERDIILEYTRLFDQDAHEAEDVMNRGLTIAFLRRFVQELSVGARHYELERSLQDHRLALAAHVGPFWEQRLRPLREALGRSRITPPQLDQAFRRYDEARFARTLTDDERRVIRAFMARGEFGAAARILAEGIEPFPLALVDDPVVLQEFILQSRGPWFDELMARSPLALGQARETWGPVLESLKRKTALAEKGWELAQAMDDEERRSLWRDGKDAILRAVIDAGGEAGRAEEVHLALDVVEPLLGLIPRAEAEQVMAVLNALKDDFKDPAIRARIERLQPPNSPPLGGSSLGLLTFFLIGGLMAWFASGDVSSSAYFLPVAAGMVSGRHQDEGPWLIPGRPVMDRLHREHGIGHVQRVFDDGRVQIRFHDFHGRDIQRTYSRWQRWLRITTPYFVLPAVILRHPSRARRLEALEIMEREFLEPRALRYLYQAREQEDSPLVREALERVIGRIEHVAQQLEQHRRRDRTLLGLIWLPGLPHVIDLAKRLVSGDVEWRQAAGVGVIMALLGGLSLASAMWSRLRAVDLERPVGVPLIGELPLRNALGIGAVAVATVGTLATALSWDAAVMPIVATLLIGVLVASLLIEPSMWRAPWQRAVARRTASSLMYEFIPPERPIVRRSHPTYHPARSWFDLLNDESGRAFYRPESDLGSDPTELPIPDLSTDTEQVLRNLQPVVMAETEADRRELAQQLAQLNEEFGAWSAEAAVERVRTLRARFRDSLRAAGLPFLDWREAQFILHPVFTETLLELVKRGLEDPDAGRSIRRAIEQIKAHADFAEEGEEGVRDDGMDGEFFDTMFIRSAREGRPLSTDEIALFLFMEASLGYLERLAEAIETQQAEVLTQLRDVLESVYEEFLRLNQWDLRSRLQGAQALTLFHVERTFDPFFEVPQAAVAENTFFAPVEAAAEWEAGSNLVIAQVPIGRVKVSWWLEQVDQEGRELEFIVGGGPLDIVAIVDAADDQAVSRISHLLHGVVAPQLSGMVREGLARQREALKAWVEQAAREREEPAPITARRDLKRITYLGRSSVRFPAWLSWYAESGVIGELDEWTMTLAKWLLLRAKRPLSPRHELVDVYRAIKETLWNALIYGSRFSDDPTLHMTVRWKIEPERLTVIVEDTGREPYGTPLSTFEDPAKAEFVERLRRLKITGEGQGALGLAVWTDDYHREILRDEADNKIGFRVEMVWRLREDEIALVPALAGGAGPENAEASRESRRAILE